MATAVVGTKIYFFGGIMEDYLGTNNSYSYDTTTDTWSQLAEYVRAFYGGCAATDGNDTIWVFGR
jgi:N-acetylneuraminic acid mutarotase